MTIQIKSVEPQRGARLELKFSDGTTGVADLSKHLTGKVFAPLTEPELFAKAYVDGGTVCWPNGADFAPEFLYALAHELPQPDSLEQVAQNELEMSLRELRRVAGMTQDEVAQALGIEQGEVSRWERRADRKVSTVRKFVEALGGKLEVVAELDGKRVVLRGLLASSALARRPGMPMISAWASGKPSCSWWCRCRSQ